MFKSLLDRLEYLNPEIELGEADLPVSLTITIPVTEDLDKLTAELIETIMQLRRIKVE